MAIQLLVDASVYPLEAVQKASYRFIDRLTVMISQTPSHIICDIEAVATSELDFEAVLASFKREMLDQQLRQKIKIETEDVRNLILSYAFSRSGLQA